MKKVATEEFLFIFLGHLHTKIQSLYTLQKLGKIVPEDKWNKGCVALPFMYMKTYLKAKKKTYENSNISPCKNYNLQKKNPLKETKILQDIIITL